MRRRLLLRPARRAIGGRSWPAHLLYGEWLRPENRRVGRTVSAVVTWGDAYLRVIGPFPVSVPWWSEAEPVVAYRLEAEAAAQRD